MVALLAHSFGAGFTIVVEAFWKLFAGWDRPAGQTLHDRASEEIRDRHAASLAQDLARALSLFACDVISVWTIETRNKKIGLSVDFQTRK